ncbi:hypothetical protein [uncultured Aquabacterium sp.]|jgi:hypothetical protein|uniref:hypothetical protein n=1 Tax=uncultured Aquabacterium sp. TaxID=158753 RepID=UPI002626FAAA|nr:hypothetical protein [uncultured Aquabacterium sp.]
MPRPSDRRLRSAPLSLRPGRLAPWAESARFWLPFAAVVLAVWFTVPVSGAA